MKPVGPNTAGFGTFAMLKITHVCVERLSADGKKYKWEKLSECPGCKSKRVWGHGYVCGYFEGFTSPLWLKRFRCDNCHVVITLKPSGYFRRFQTSIKSIYEALNKRFNSGKWPAKVTRQRAGQWLRRFITFLRMTYGDDNDGVPMTTRLTQLYEKEVKFLVEIS